MARYSPGRSVVGAAFFVAGAALLFVPASVDAQTPSELDRMAASRGAENFRRFCASCHGKQAMGDGPLAKDLKVQPANLTELSIKNDGAFPYGMVIETIEHGRSVRGHGSQDMPAWGDAFETTSQTGAEAQAKTKQLAHYLWSPQVDTK